MKKSHPQVFRRPGAAARRNFDDALEVVPVVYELAERRNLSQADISREFKKAIANKRKREGRHKGILSAGMTGASAV